MATLEKKRAGLTVGRALLIGGGITFATYSLALLCAAAGLHTAFAILAWPSFAITRLLPPGEPVTSGSPSSPWLPLATVGIAWLFYSATWYFWRRRLLAAGA